MKQTTRANSTPSVACILGGLEQKHFDPPFRAQRQAETPVPSRVLAFTPTLRRVSIQMCSVLEFSTEYSNPQTIETIHPPLDTNT